MVLALILRDSTALEDPWVRENFYDMGMGWVDGNSYISTTAPDDLEEIILDREWGELVDVEVLSDEEALEMSGAEGDFNQDSVGAARAVSDALDGDGREWAHYGVYGTPDSTWLVVPSGSPDSGITRLDDETALPLGEDAEEGEEGEEGDIPEY